MRPLAPKLSYYQKQSLKIGAIFFSSLLALVLVLSFNYYRPATGATSAILSFLGF